MLSSTSSTSLMSLEGDVNVVLTMGKGCWDNRERPFPDMLFVEMEEVVAAVLLTTDDSAAMVL